jgi:hypothetical protein
MQSLDFGVNTPGGAEKFITLVNDISDGVDPFGKANWDPNTGEVVVKHLDGTTTNTGEFVVPNDNDGKIYKGKSDAKSGLVSVKKQRHVIRVYNLSNMTQEQIDKMRGKKSGKSGKGGGKTLWDWLKDMWPGDGDDEGKPPAESEV